MMDLSDSIKQGYLLLEDPVDKVVLALDCFNFCFNSLFVYVL